jgi:hypothetical protein
MKTIPLLLGCAMTALTPSACYACCGIAPPCWYANSLGIPCVNGLTTSNFFKGPIGAPALPATKPPPWGTTPTQVEAGFAQNVLYYFEVNPHLDAAVRGMQPMMLSRLSTEMAARDPSGYFTWWTLAYAATRVSAPTLRLLQAAFGTWGVGNALAYAPPTVRNAYNTLPVSAPLLFSQYWVGAGNALPAAPSSRYLYDLFLEQYLSTNDSVNVAMHKAVVYAQIRMKNAVWEGIVAVGVILGYVEFFDHDAWQDFRNWLFPTGGGAVFGTIDRPITVTIPASSYTWPVAIPPDDTPTFPPIELSPDEEFCILDSNGDC